MAKVTCANGVVLEWDDTLTVGQLIVAYEKGYHILTRIDWRDDGPPLMTYVRVVSADGKRVKGGKELVCDASYVRAVTAEDIQRIYEADTNAAITKRDNLLDFVSR